MRTRFDQQLEELHRELIRMGSLCEQAIALSAKLIMQEEGVTAEAVYATDEQIDRKEQEIESLCLRLLLQQQPVARDLRTISAAMKMISDMERIGDQAADLAELAPYLSGTDLPNRVPMGQMALAAVKMVTDSVEAFVKNDLRLAHKVMQEDDQVDVLFNQVRQELTELIFRKDTDARAALDLLMAAKYFERIGDHAVNIAEWVEYSITGEHESNEHHPGNML